MIADATGPSKSRNAISPERAFRPSLADPPWSGDDPRRDEIGHRIPANHLARWIDTAVDQLDLSTLRATYSGRGSKPVPPILMVKMVMFELASGRPSPGELFRDTRERDSVKWLGRGVQPARSTCYDFWNRIAPLIDGWIKQVLCTARNAGLLEGKRVAQDGTAIAANASRHRMVKQETLLRRAKELDVAIAADKNSLPVDAPRWMAKRPETRLMQRDRYRRAEEQMRQLQAENQQRRASKRQDAKKIVVSTSDPDAVASRDKHHVFRPLYNVQLLRDVDSPFILAYQVYNRNHDSGRLAPMIERCMELAGCEPRTVLVDSGYLSVLDLAECERLGVTPYGPIGSNDYSQANERQPQTNSKTKIPKRQFRWVPEEHVYVCPKNHRLEAVKQGAMKRHGERRLQTEVFQCAADKCASCTLRSRCTPHSKNGRTISRIEHEELADALRERMENPDAKAIYKLRAQTIERPFADWKEHRGVRRFCRRGLRLAQAQTGAFVLCRNLLALHCGQNADKPHPPATRILTKMRC